MVRWWNWIRRRAHGQATVEFALVSTLFLLIILGTVDFGRAIFLNSQLESAVRDAAREGKVGFTNGTSGMSAARLQDHVRNAWNAETQQTSPRPGLANAAVTVTCTGSCSTGDRLTISATLPFQAITQKFLGIDPLTLHASATVVLE
jgi:Flp pilus assembly protein TadG